MRDMISETSYRAVMLEKLCIRTPGMQSLQPLNQVLELTPEAFGNANIEARLVAVGGFVKPFKDFLLPQSIVLELLGRLAHVHMRREDVVQAKLPRKHVHHDPSCTVHITMHLALVVVVSTLGMLTTWAQWEPVESVCVCQPRYTLGRNGMVSAYECGATRSAPNRGH